MADLSDLAAAIEHKISYALHTSMLGKIVSYDASKQTATVQPLTMGVYWTDTVVDDVPVAKKVYYRYKPLPNVPVMFPGGNGFTVTWPLAAGDTCILQFTEDSLADALTSGDEGPQTSVARHQMSHAMCLPVYVPQPNPKTDSDTTGNQNMMIGQSGGTKITIDPADGEIILNAAGVVLLGSGAEHLVALSNLVDSAISTIVSAFNSHTHPTTSPGSPTGPPAVLISPAPGSTAAEITKAK